MLNIRRIYLKFYNSVLLAIMAALGFAPACSQTQYDEYGTLYAEFQVSGKVESAASNQALENILVEIENDSLFTDQNGEYAHEWMNFEPSKGHFVMKFSQIEGIESGEYEPLDTVIYYQTSEFEGGEGAWYYGKFTKTVNVSLQAKSDK